MVNDAMTPALRHVLAPLQDEGIESPREQLILWIIRNQYGVGAEDSYASILDDRELFPGVEVDAVLVTTRRDLVSPVYVVYGESPAELRTRVADLGRALREEDAPEIRLARTNSQLRSLFEPAADRRIGSDVSRLVLCVCMADVAGAARNGIINAAREVADVDVIDRRFIEALAEADLSPTASMPTVEIAVDLASILDLKMQDADAIVTAVPVEQIAKWEGIADRTLFDLNVRYALGLNRVRRSLDAALQDKDSADEFIAYHNGITAVCSNFRVTDVGVEIDGLSVVNGAQTVVAIHANAERLAPGLRVLFKLVKAAPDSQLATNIAVRSNTQNPVTSRNLRALDEVQARLQSELGALGYVYTRRPNDREAAGDQVIRNDDVAQLLCSIYARKPALAVKRQVLFEYPLYSEIFPTDIDPARVVFATLLRKEVEEHKRDTPEYYQKAWALTALTLVNMTAEAMRDDPEGGAILLSPGDAIGDSLRLRELIAPFVAAACEVLRERAATFAEKQLTDDFKVTFKQTRTLSDLAIQASKAYRRGLRSVNA